MCTKLVLESDLSYDLKELKSKYSQFSSSTQNEMFTIGITVEEGIPFVAMQPGPWEVHTRSSDGSVEFESYLEKGWFDLKAMQGKLILRPRGNPENFLRVLYAWRCLEKDALLLHASGLIRGTKGFVFFGKSGSGKTTITRNASGSLILSDDLVILKSEKFQDGKNRVRVYGVPFRGGLGEAIRTNASAQLCGLFSLIKDQKHQIRRLIGSDAVALLATCVPFVMSQPENARRVLELCQELNNCVHVNALHFKPDPGFLGLIDG